MRFLKAMQTSDRGKLQIQITSSIVLFPFQMRQSSVSYTGIPESPM